MQKLQKLTFKITVPNSQLVRVKIVGDVPELGSWNYQQGHSLTNKKTSIWESESPVWLRHGQKFQFKIVKVSADGKNVEWETLPKDSNRKFKMHQDIILKMEWSNPKGEKIELSKRKSHKLVGLPSVGIEDNKFNIYVSVYATGVVISSPIRRKYTAGEGGAKFNPFKFAEFSGSEGEEGLQELDVYAASTKEFSKKLFEQIFYSYSKVRSSMTLSRLSVAQNVFVVARDLPSNNPFYEQALSDLTGLGVEVTWVYEYSDKSGPANGSGVRYISIRQKKSTSLPQNEILQVFEKRLGQLIPHNSICIILDKSLIRLKLRHSFNAVFLGGAKLNQTEVPELMNFNMEYIKFIAFDSADYTEKYLEAMLGKTDFYQADEETRQKLEFLRSSKPEHKIIHKIYQQLKQQQIEEMNIRSKDIRRLDTTLLAKHMAEKEHRLLILDFALLQKIPPGSKFLSDLQALASHKQNLICVVAQCSRTSIEASDNKKLLQLKNLIWVTGNGKEVRMGNQWMDVLERHNRNLQILKRKFKEYIQKHGGEESFDLEHPTRQSMSYKHCEQSKCQEILVSIKDLLTQEKYMRVSKTGKEVKVSWKLVERLRTLQSILTLRCMISGVVDFAMAMVADPEQDFIMGELDKLVRSTPHYFRNLEKVYAIQGIRISNNANFYILAQDLGSLRLCHQK